MRKFEGIDTFNQIYLNTTRQPKIRVLLFDRSEVLYKIVLGNYTQKPLNITRQTIDINITDSIDNASSANLTLTNTEGLTPKHFLGRPIIKIQETDKRILNNYGNIWITVFTGVVVGQPGFNTLTRDEIKTIKISCIDRTFFYNKKQLATENFDQDKDFGDIAIEIATNEEYGMGLIREEVDFGKQYYTVQHTYVSIREVPYFEGLSLLTFILDKRPSFSSDGTLVLRNTDINKIPNRIYQNLNCFKKITWNQENIEVINQVKIIGLASVSEKISFPRQIVAEVTGMLGYFMSRYEETIYYSEDRSQRAELPEINSFKINGWLESVTPSDIEVIVNDEYSCLLMIKTPWNTWVFIAFFVGYVAFFVLAAFDFLGIGKVLEIAAAIWLVAGLSMMQQLGVFKVSISAKPYQIVYKEIIGVADWNQLKDYEIRTKEIKNHLVDTQILADTLAKRELEREKIKEHSRQITLLHDPLLEPDDVIEMPNGTRYYILSINRKYIRSNVSTMEITALLCKGGDNDY